MTFWHMDKKDAARKELDLLTNELRWPFAVPWHAGPAWVDAWTLIYGTNVPGLWPKKCVLPRYSPIRHNDPIL